MSSKREISPEDLEQLVDDASYLEDEAEALKYVIEDVPYDESPPGKRSIAEMLLLLDHAQLSYYRPILEESANSKRPISLYNFDHFEDTFEVDESKIKDIQKLLSKLAKHRAGVVNVINNISLIDWESVVYKNDREIILFDLAQQMIRYDHKILKEIADQVMVFNQDKQARREIKNRQMQRNPQETPNSQ